MISTDDDLLRATRQLLRAVRGSRSQVAFSRRLGYRGNPVADWEAGRRLPTALELLRACRLSRIDVDAAFRRFHAPAAPLLGDAERPQLHLWLDALRGNTPVVTLAERSGHSRFAVGRWLKGRATPRVHEWLRLVEASTGRASDLVAELVPIERVPALLPSYRTRQQARRLAFEQPWTEAILRLIESRDFSLSGEPGPRAMASILQVDLEVVTRALDAMREAGIVRERGGRLVESGALNVDTRGDPEGFNQLRRHWAEVAAQRLRQPQAQDWFAYNVLTLSEDELQRARAILRDAYRQVRGLAAASTQPERAVLLNMHLLQWPVDEDER